MLRLLSAIGSWTVEVVSTFGKITILFLDAVRSSVIPPFRFKNVIRQMDFLGAKSFYIIVFTGFFTGMVLALNGYLTFRILDAETMVGATVAIAMVREMGPVLASIMVIARAGSAIAAELGTMRITEQIDALTTMSVNPVKYLITPRLIAGITMMPILATIFSVTGFIGSYFVCIKLFGINAGDFMANVHDILEMEDFTKGLIKSLFFGLFLTLIACYYGYYTSGGAEGVGKSTNKAVVAGCVTIIISDYFLTALLWR
jgi:phospholipid/cholesterol/gamma-HCH transport system permease protein